MIAGLKDIVYSVTVIFLSIFLSILVFFIMMYISGAIN